MVLPPKEYGSTPEEFGEKSLTFKEFHIFFSPPIEILNFYGLSEEFFFSTDVKCNRPLR